MKKVLLNNYMYSVGERTRKIFFKFFFCLCNLLFIIEKYLPT